MKKRLIKKLYKKGLIKYGDKRLKKIYSYINFGVSSRQLHAVGYRIHMEYGMKLHSSSSTLISFPIT